MAAKAAAMAAPGWRTPWSALADPDAPCSKAAYPGIFDSHAGQEEDVLTDAVVKNGFVSRPIVSNETFSAHVLIYDKLRGPDALGQLSKLVSDVVEAKETAGAELDPPSFKLPSRTTLNEHQREAWLSELANPAVPLSRLSRSIPHLAKGERLVELLVSKQVPTDRAVWLIRLIGAYETRARSGQSSAYAVEWTTGVCDFLRTLLNEIVLPAATATMRHGITVKGKARATLGEPDLRARWVARFGSPSVSLIRQLYSEELLSRSTLFEWLLAQLGSVHLGQLPFVLFLLGDVQDDILRCSGSALQLVEGCLARLSELATDALKDDLKHVSTSLQLIIENAFDSTPDVFASPRLWLRHGSLIREYLSDSVELARVARRVDDLLGVDTGSSAQSSISRVATSIRVLDDLRHPVDWSVASRSFFSLGALGEQMDILLAWSATVERVGVHRRYAAVSLLSAHLRSLVRAPDVHAEIVRWIGECARDEAACDRLAVAATVAELARCSLFSYGRYLQSMIAHGQTGARPPDRPASLHQYLLATLPLYAEATTLALQRRVTLRTSADDIAAAAQRVDRAFAAVQAAMPVLVGVVPSLPSPAPSSSVGSDQAVEVRASDPSVIAMRSALVEVVSLDEREQLAYGRVLPLVVALGGQLDVPSFAIVVDALVTLEAVHTLAEVIIAVARSTSSCSVVSLVLDVVGAEIESLVAARLLERVVDALNEARGRMALSSTWPDRADKLLHALAHPQSVRPRLAVAPATAAELPSFAIELQLISLDASPDELTRLAGEVASRGQTGIATAVVKDALAAIALVPEKARVLARLLAVVERTSRVEMAAAVVSVMAPVDAGRMAFAAALVESGVLSIVAFLEHGVLPALNADDTRDTAIAALGSLLALVPDGVNTLNDAQRHAALVVELCSRASFDLVLRLSARLSAHPVDSLAGRVLDCLAASVAFQAGLFATLPASTTMWLEVANEMPLAQQTSALDVFARLLHSSPDGSGNIFAADSWTALPAHVAPWRLESTRAALQVYLRQLSLQREDEMDTSIAPSTPGRQLFIERLMLDSDASVADDLIGSFDAQGAEQLSAVAMSRLITALESVQPEQPTSVDAFLPTCHRLIRLLGHLLSLGSTSLGLADDGGVRFIAAWLAAAQKADVGDVALAAALARVVVIVGRFDGLWTGNEHELGLAAKALADLALAAAMPDLPRFSHAQLLSDALMALLEPQRDATARHLTARIAELPSPTSALVAALAQRARTAPVASPALHLFDGAAPHDGTTVEALRPSAYELVDHTEAAPPATTRPATARTWAQNGSFVDLALVGAGAIETVATGGPSAERPTVGAQCTFDSEVPTARESIWIRAFRRSLRPPVPSMATARAAAAQQAATTPLPATAADSPAVSGKMDSPIVVADDSPTVAVPVERPSKKRRSSAIEGGADDGASASAPKKKAKPRLGMGAGTSSKSK